MFTRNLLCLFLIVARVTTVWGAKDEDEGPVIPPSRCEGISIYTFADIVPPYSGTYLPVLLSV